MLWKWIEHSEIDFKNLTNSDQSQFMIKDIKFRKAYFECFNHEPIECIWPEMISEWIEEPDIFVNIDIMKMLITKKTGKEANIYTLKNQLLFKLKIKNCEYNSKLFSKITDNKNSKSVECQEEIDLQIKVKINNYLIST